MGVNPFQFYDFSLHLNQTLTDIFQVLKILFSKENF